MAGKQSTIPPFEQHPLDVQLTEGEVVRLIELAPGTGTQPVHVKLSIHELTDSPPFDAISYVWGDETQRGKLQCNGRTLLVTKSLDAALKRVRLPDKPRLVWADAICINQSDDIEKAHHVAFMRKVYRSARLVLICMGNDPDGAGPDIVSLLESHSKREGYPNLKDMPVLHSSDATFLDPRWKSLAIVMSNIWWQRAWTLQESGVAKIPLVLFGDAQIEYRGLMRLNRWIVACADELQYKYKISLLTIHSDWEQWTGGWAERQDYTYTVVDFLSHTKGLGCTEPRDHVYAFIGHPLLMKADGSGALVPVSYEVPVAQVFRNLTELILTQVGLLILAAVEHDTSTIKDLSMPSWVVSWDKDIIQNSFGYYQHFYYDASRSASSNFTMVGDSLSLRSFHLSRVAAVFQFPEDPETWAVEEAIPALESKPTLRSLLEEIRLEITLSNLPCRYALSEREDALSLTLTSGLRTYLAAEDNLHLHRADRDAFWQALDTVLASCKTQMDPKKADGTSADGESQDSGSRDRYFYDLSLACKGRCFMVTEDGWWGVGPWVMRVGDHVKIIQGAKVPFVLRPVTAELFDAKQALAVDDKPGGDQLGKQYRLVGEAYVHGVMRGEALDDEAVWTETVVR